MGRVSLICQNRIVAIGLIVALWPLYRVSPGLAQEATGVVETEQTGSQVDAQPSTDQSTEGKGKPAGAPPDEPDVAGSQRSEASATQSTGDESDPAEVNAQPDGDRPMASEEPGSWAGRVEELSMEILLGEAERSDADALLRELEPQLKGARDRLRELLAEGAAVEELRPPHRSMEDLYDARIALLGQISTRDLVQMTSWGVEGVREAQAELDRLLLHVRYEGRRVPAQVFRLLDNVRTSPIPLLKTVLAVFLIIFAFRLWRRWASKALPAIRQSLIGARPRTRRNLRLAKAVWYLDRLRPPLEWLILLAAIGSLISSSLALIDERPGVAIIKWVFIGWFGFNLVNSIAARGGAGLGRDSSDLRQRSLKLIWTWIASFGLGLELAGQFVGRGTLYSWVWWVMLVLGLPVLLIIIHWWREEVFRRAAQETYLPASIRHRLPRSGEKGGYVPTAVVGSYLIARGIQRQLLRAVSRFEVGRRILAYAFRREVARQAEAQKQDDGSVPLPEAIEDQILAGGRLISKVYRSQVRDLVEVAGRGGATLVVVGDRGTGKSTVLRRVEGELGDRVLYLDCPPGGIDRFMQAVSEQLGIGDRSGANLQLFADLLQQRGVDVLAIDNVHRMVRPAMDGMRDVDRLSELLDQLGRGISRIFALDTASWVFVRRSRQERLIPDRVISLEPWSENEIGELLEARAEAVQIQPDYSRLQLPRQLDEAAYEVEHDRKRYGFYRILWDSSDGIPAVALRLWCESLRMGQDGKIFVRIFPQREVGELEELNLSAKFVLRSVSQMEYTDVEQIVDALRIDRKDIESAVRFALIQGYLEETDGFLHVSWPWYRSVRRLLARQNMLVTG